MKTPLSYEQMTMITERAHRERNAAIRELFTTFPGKVLDFAASGFERFVRILLVDAKSGL